MKLPTTNSSAFQRNPVVGPNWSPRFIPWGFPRSAARSGHALVRMAWVQPCASDLRWLRGDKNGSLVSIRRVAGHEGVGWVIDPGGARHLRAGAFVVVLPHHVCGRCDRCLDGDTQRCRQLSHLGFDEDGVFADVVSVPHGCLRPLGDGFPASAGPLVEPLACVLRGVERLAAAFGLSAKGSAGRLEVGVYGSGPMGSLMCLALQRLPGVRTCLIDSNPHRQATVRSLGLANEVLPGRPADAPFDVTVVAASSLQANLDAIATARRGVLLFAGINRADRAGDGAADAQAQWLEGVHRDEREEVFAEGGAGPVRLVGSSGYNHRSISASVRELSTDPGHYGRVQNVRIDGLRSHEARFLAPEPGVVQFDVPAVEVFLSPAGIYDANHGPHLARALKVLIRVAEE